MKRVHSSKYQKSDKLIDEEVKQDQIKDDAYGIDNLANRQTSGRKSEGSISKKGLENLKRDSLMEMDEESRQ